MVRYMAVYDTPYRDAVLEYVKNNDIRVLSEYEQGRTLALESTDEQRKAVEGLEGIFNTYDDFQFTPFSPRL